MRAVLQPCGRARRARLGGAVLGALLVSLATVSLTAATAGINLGSTAQTVRGFGGACVWLGELSDTTMDKAYTANAGCVGLTINRIRIDPTRAWTTELNNAKKAASRGAINFATPWSPPASMKTNGNTVHGSLSTSQYGAYASYLNEFSSYMSSNGASLYAISVQNEPDFDPDYESCTYTSTQMFNFVRYNAAAPTSRAGIQTAARRHHRSGTRRRARRRGRSAAPSAPRFQRAQTQRILPGA